MGKLVEKLQQVGQSSGGGMGFFGSSRAPARLARPAAVLVSLGMGDAAGVEAAGKNGADAVIVTGWKPGASLDGIQAAAAPNGLAWGVEYATGRAADDTLATLRDAGASFAVVDGTAPAGLLVEEVERFDLAVGIVPPRDDLGLLMLRAESLLPVRVALVKAGFSDDDLARLTVSEFARLRLVFEGLRFPALVTLTEAPATAHVRTLVRMGAAGIVLPGEGVSAQVLGAQVKELREELEKTPARGEDRGAVAIGELIGQAGKALPQQPPRREPSPEPEKE